LSFFDPPTRNVMHWDRVKEANVSATLYSPHTRKSGIQFQRWLLPPSSGRSWLFPLLLYSPRRNKQFCSWYRSSIVLGFRAIETIFIGTRTRYILGLRPLFP
jgi:hypothetical protein